MQQNRKRGENACHTLQVLQVWKWQLVAVRSAGFAGFKTELSPSAGFAGFKSELSR
jgi:hypothetical protein